MCHSFVTSWTPFFVWRIFSLYIPWEYLLSLLKVQMPDPNFSGFLRTIENFKIHKSREKSTTFPLLPFNHLQQWALTPQSHPRLSVLPLLPLHSPLLPVLQPPSHPYSSSSMVSKLPLLPRTDLLFVFAAFRTRLKDHQSGPGLASLLPKIAAPAPCTFPFRNCLRFDSWHPPLRFIFYSSFFIII